MTSGAAQDRGGEGCVFGLIILGLLTVFALTYDRDTRACARAGGQQIAATCVRGVAVIPWDSVRARKP